MEIMIPVPLVLPDEPLNVAALEATVVAWGRTVQQHAFAQAWAAQATRAVPVCPHCTSPAVRRAGTTPRRLETVFGPVTLRRRRYQCRGCGRHFHPDEAALTASVGRGRCTPALRELAAACGASWPYAQAAAILTTIRGVGLAPETIRAGVQQLGTAVATQQAAQAAAVCAPTRAASPELTEAPATLEVTLDGGWIHSRDNPHGMEVKVGVVHPGRQLVGQHRPQLVGRRLAATANGVASFGPRVTAAIDHQHGYTSATTEQTVLGDGAAWIWTLASEILPEATPMLDRWHLADARRRALRAVLPDKTARAPWNARLDPLLEKGDVPGAVAVLTELTTQLERTADTPVPEFAAFLQHQASHIPDYAARRAAGQVIGSGAVEKGVDLLVNRRLKGRQGMRWWRARANDVIALRVARLNDEWDQSIAAALAA